MCAGGPSQTGILKKGLIFGLEDGSRGNGLHKSPVKTSVSTGNEDGRQTDKMGKLKRSASRSCSDHQHRRGALVQKERGTKKEMCLAMQKMQGGALAGCADGTGMGETEDGRNRGREEKRPGEVELVLPIPTKKGAVSRACLP